MRILALMPSLFDTSPGQRYRFEQWDPLLRERGAEITYAPFEDEELHALVHEPGLMPKKLRLVTRALARRLTLVRNVKDYDLVYIHEALHDMSYPVDVLAACRRLLADGGSLIVGDERVADTFDAPGDEIERFYYGCSILHCLPVGMLGENAAGTGTVMRADTVRGYAEQARFSRFEILPIENDFYRFYLMS